MCRRTEPAAVGNQAGAVQVSLFALFAVLCIGGFGTLGLTRFWRYQMETQLRLNQCVGIRAQELRDTLNSLEWSNWMIRGTRLSIEAAMASAQLYLIPPLRLGLTFLVGEQTILLTQWKFRQGQWILQRGCGLKEGDMPSLLPSLLYVRDPPDPIGQSPLRWHGEMPSYFEISLKHSFRVARARVSRDEKKNGKNDSQMNSKYLILISGKSNEILSKVADEISDHLLWSSWSAKWVSGESESRGHILPRVSGGTRSPIFDYLGPGLH